MKKKIELIVSAVALLAGIILTVIGYTNNVDGIINTKALEKFDYIALLGIGIIFASVVLVIKSIIDLSKHKEDVVADDKNKKKQDVMRLAFAAMFAALSYIGFQFFRIDITVGADKTAFHLGNTFVVLAALFLGGTWGGYAGAVGLTLADLTSGYVTSAPKTFILKLLIGLIVGTVAHKIFHISKPQSKSKYIVGTIVATVLGLGFNIVADPLGGYLYKTYLFGVPQDLAKALAKVATLTTAVNAAASAVFAIVLYLALRPALQKAGLFYLVEDDFDKQ